MLFQKNDYIGHYKVMFPHKRGAYAETYRVKNSQGKTMFLKLINPGKLDRYQTDDDGKIIELEVARKLIHHNLCGFIDSGTIINSGMSLQFFITEYVSGETLSEKIARDGELDVYQIKQIARAVLSALSFLHSQRRPIIHNEITVQNILLNLTGTLDDLKLIDFGYARFLGQQLAKPDVSKLNPFYIATERFAGAYSVQSDIFSVGAVMYYLLYNRLPWFVDTSYLSGNALIDAVLTERDKPLAVPTIDAFELDDQFVNTICKALSTDPAQRFQSADEFIKAIDGEMKVEKSVGTTPSNGGKRPVLTGGNEDDNRKTDSPVKAEKATGDGFKAIAGMDELKQRLTEDVIEPLNNPEEYRRYDVTIPNGMLLYGPPGCGKTFFAKHFAEEVGFSFMMVTPATLKSRWVNATQENIAAMFKEAKENAPTIIFIDEMNELVPNRQSDVHEMSRSAVNEMLAQMNCTGENGVFIIGATNYPDMIDPAIMRAGRLDRKYYIGPPDAAARKALFKLYLKTRPFDFGIDYDLLSEKTNGYVSADIQMIVNDASRTALRLHSKITQDLLLAAIDNTRPSLDKKELERYARINDMMEGRTPTKPDRPKIGF